MAKPQVFSSIEQIPGFNNSHVKIRDKEGFLKKINNMIADGKDKLQIITDYDLTITKQHINGERTLSSFGLLTLCEQLPPGFIEADRKLVGKYYPIESDPHLSAEQKMPHMIEWYQQSQQLFNGIAFDLQELRRVINEKGPELRDGSVDLFKLLENEQVPVLVLSAGLGNVVDEVLKHHGLTSNQNFHIVSNFLTIEDGIVKGFGCDENGTFLHTLNKNGTGCKSYFEKLGSKRHNVILMGDSVGDHHMSDGVPQAENVLKIGFLYGSSDHLSNSLEKYSMLFDIVLVDDQTMEVPRSIINSIINKSTI